MARPDHLGHGRFPGHPPRVGAQPQQVTATLLDQRGEQLEGVPTTADLAVEGTHVLDSARPGPGPRGGEKGEGRRQLDQPVAGQLGRDRFPANLVSHHVREGPDDDPAVSDPGDLARDQRRDQVRQVVRLDTEGLRHRTDLAAGQGQQALIEPFVLS